MEATVKRSVFDNYDYWEHLRGEYEEPTKREFNIIAQYSRKTDFERDDFVEDECWRSRGEKVPNLRPLLLKALHQIRESKGYDVESNVGGLLPFVPAKQAPQSYIDEAMEATRVAITTINSQSETMKAYQYQLVSVDNFVYAMLNRCYLLTLTVEEVFVDGEDALMADANADAALKTMRARSVCTI